MEKCLVRLRQFIYCLVLLFIGNASVAQNVCPPNIDFEFGDFTNWQCYTGTTSSTGGGGSPPNCTPGVNTVNAVPSAPIPGRHTIINPSQNTDPFGGFYITPGSSASVTGTTKVARLGFVGQTNAQIERLSYTFTIPASATTYSLQYKYAVVYQDPNHCQPVQPHFEAKVFDVTTGQYINCASFEYYATPGQNGFQQSTNTSQGVVYYKNWTPVTFILSDYIGHTIRVEFTNADCTAGGHWAYCYVDISNNCSSPVIGGTFCPGSPSVSLTAPFDYQSYNWFNAGFGTPISTAQTLTLTPPPTVQTPVAVEVIPFPGLGCRDTIYATIKPLPVVPVNAGVDRLLCGPSSSQGPSTLGSPSLPGYTYDWAPAAGLNDTALAQPIATPTVTTDYILTMTDNVTGCTKNDTVTVTVAPFLSATYTINTPNQCLAGNSYQFTSNTANPSGTIYSWNFGDNSALNTQANPTYSYPTPGNYTVKLTTTNASGCIDTMSQNVIISAGAVADAGADKAFCGGTSSSAVIGTPALTGYTYSWSPATGLSSTTAAQPTATPTTTTTYILTATAPGNCFKNDTVVVTVAPSISPVFTVNNATQCLDVNSFQYTSSPTNPSGVSYNWDLGNGTSTQQNPSTQYTAAGNYTVKLVVSVAGGSCKDSSTQNITVNPMPVADAGADKLLCGGTSSSAVIGTPSVTGYTYSWSPAAGLSSATTAQPTASPAASTTYILTVTGTGGCIKKDTVNVNVTAAITGVFTVNNAAQCLTNNNFQFNINNPSGLTYNWSFGDTYNSAQQNPSHSYAAPGTYTVKVNVSGSGGCADSSTQTVTVNAVPAADAGADKLLCGGTTTGAQIGTAAVNGYTYSWSPATGLSSATAAQPTALPAATTAYVLTVTGAGGCFTKDTVNVNVTPTITGVFTVNNAAQCLTNNNFQFNINNPSGLTYDWSFGDNGSSTQQNPTHAYSTSGTYTVKVKVIGSASCSDSSTQTVTVNPMPVANAGADKTLCGGTGASTVIGTAAVTGYTYSWSPSAGLNSSTTAEPIASPSATTDYIVTVTGAGGCVTKDTVKVTVTQALGSAFTVNDNAQCVTGNAFQFNMTNPLPGLTYSWNFGDNGTSTQQNPSHAYTAAGSYVVKVNLTSPIGCKDSSSQTITVSDIPTGAISASGTIICEGTPVVLTATGTPSNTYGWYSGGTQVATTTTPTYNASQPGTYTVVLDNGCVNNGVGSVTLTLTRKPTVDYTFMVKCLGNPTVFTDGSNVTGSLPVDYLWNFGGGLPTSTQPSPTVTYPVAGTYNVAFTVTPQACPSLATTATKPVTVKGPTPNARYADKAALEGVSLQLQARNIGTTYSWSPGTNLNNANIMMPVFQGMTEVDYTITITDNLGCTTVDSQLVKVFKEVNIFMPKAFTPNGDGQNDRIAPFTIGIKSIRLFRVINRWGVIVYEGKNDVKGWDGTYKGAPQPMDGYVWELQAVDYFGKNHTRQGSFTLIR